MRIEISKSRVSNDYDFLGDYTNIVSIKQKLVIGKIDISEINKILIKIYNCREFIHYRKIHVFFNSYENFKYVEKIIDELLKYNCIDKGKRNVIIHVNNKELLNNKYLNKFNVVKDDNYLYLGIDKNSHLFRFEKVYGVEIFEKNNILKFILLSFKKEIN